MHLGRTKRAAAGLIFGLALILAVPSAHALTVPLTVKEAANVGTANVLGGSTYPVSVVVPLPYGEAQNANGFCIKQSGSTIPAQFEVLNRWWARDNSIRHLLVHFQASVGAFGDSSAYSLTDSSCGATPSTPLTVNDTGTHIEVKTGPLCARIRKGQFNIIDELRFDAGGNCNFTNSQLRIASSNQNGGRYYGVSNPSNPNPSLQADATIASPTIEIEESGPTRAVIAASLLTQHNNGFDIRHGYKVRLYFYADKPYIKVDYQLQNGILARQGRGMYFDQLTLDFGLDGYSSGATVRAGRDGAAVHSTTRGSGISLEQDFHDSFNVRNSGGSSIASGSESSGFLDVSEGSRGTFAAIRNFWQTWPNGLSIDGSNRLRVELFPDWSAQWYAECGGGSRTPGNCPADDAGMSSSGLYWLEDMQSTYKEALLAFHDGNASDAQLSGLARTFQFHPVVAVPVSWYQQTGVSMDLDGLVPISSRTGSSARQPSYRNDAYDHTNRFDYNFGWTQWYLHINRKWGMSQGGGWAWSYEHYMASQAPADYFEAEARALGALNARPMWLPGYEHDIHNNSVQLALVAADGEWRSQDPIYQSPYGRGSESFDEQHFWAYHIEEVYNFTGNLWIRDWYRFMKEAWQRRLSQQGSYNTASRAHAHSMANALQAFRVTGDTGLLNRITSFLRNELYPEQNADCGMRVNNQGFDQVLETGYMARMLIDYLTETRGGRKQEYAEAWNFLSGLMYWNLNNANFGSVVRPCETDVSDDVSHTMVDPQAWYYENTGRSEFLAQADDYLSGGISGGQGPSGSIDWSGWDGEYHARAYRHAKDIHAGRGDTTAPPRVSNLSVQSVNGSTVTLQWTAPSDATRYHFVWADRTLAEDVSGHSPGSTTNWWAANAAGDSPDANPGQTQTMTINVGSSGTKYFAMFSFDEENNMSSMSNVVSSNTSGGGTPPASPGGLRPN